MKQPVNADAHLDAFDFRFNVQVASAFPRSQRNQSTHQLQHRIFLNERLSPSSSFLAPHNISFQLLDQMINVVAQVIDRCDVLPAMRADIEVHIRIGINVVNSPIAEGTPLLWPSQLNLPCQVGKVHRKPEHLD